MLEDCSCLITLVIVRGGGSSSGALNPYVSIVVVMNKFSMLATSLLNQVSFCNTTFQPGFLMSSEKDTWVVWQRNMKLVQMIMAICGEN